MIKTKDHSDRKYLRLGRLSLPLPLPIASGLHGSGAVVLGWNVYGDCPKPINWLHTALTDLSKARFWLLYRLSPSHQYHLIRTGLEPGYHCEDELILHGCMAMLRRYVENFADEGKSGEEVLEEFNRKLREPDHDTHGMQECLSGQADMQAEALAIYRWWRYEKPKDEAWRDELCMRIYGSKKEKSDARTADLREEFRSLEDKIARDEQDMLHRLIEIRPGLWT